ncbi:DTW domain-containing protein [Duganella sp. FT92W]|uniref:tRNA-uridine aminocarboxypropyltransferase n=1 Tax=Pseudoduganella rivuli TaxID=2666085 RepID=A0A7X2LW41_9BURK|nr:tRNA-uridine aminocarboxypropyltransferase [Pseudoduganella rivuli]MRV75603.1 DTW domain-containing protein [Pseudoduganella rivuli]
MTLTSSTGARRAMCAACLRPQATCICRWTTPVASRAGILILQHPMEVHNAKNSARLLHLCLPGSVMAVGETFDEAGLAALLAGPRRPVLLYPDTPGDASLGIAPPPPFDPGWAGAPEQLLLVALDATWRKSRKMLYLNPALQRLPRLPLRDMPASHYRIRKAHAPDQLSTLEAVAYALGQVENNEEQYKPLINAFDGFVQQQADYLPNPAAMADNNG